MKHYIYKTSLSVQCNTLHVTEYKITCGVCVSVCLSVCAHGTLGSNISKRAGDGAWSQWGTNRKWGMGNPMVT